jgi:hypothetical protein
MLACNLFVKHGQRLSVTYLFISPLRIACRRAGLVDSTGRPTVTAHRFRHTVGTQLAERGAKLHTIMQVLARRCRWYTRVLAIEKCCGITRQCSDRGPLLLAPSQTSSVRAAYLRRRWTGSRLTSSKRN